MKSFYLYIFIALLFIPKLEAQNLEGIKLTEIKSGEKVSAKSAFEQGLNVVIFSSINCPYDDYYRNRITEMISKESNSEINFVLIYSHSDEKIEEIQNEKTKAELNTYKDQNQQLKKLFKATKSPEAYLVELKSGSIKTHYHGAIDNNPQVEGAVTEKYLEAAIELVKTGRKVTKNFQRPIGCMIR